MANLTQAEFFTIADLYPGGINIWCTESTPTQVLGITVPFIDNEGNNIQSTLEQIQTITLPVDNDAGSNVELTITSRVIRGTSPYRYYFFTVQVLNISSYVSPIANEVIQDGQVILLPNLRGGSFYLSDYNATLNIAQDNRLSDYILRNTSATYANVQDSLYSDTGWINARYDGSSTNSENYASIDSAILGSSLQGTYYPIQTSDTEINNIDVSERSYLEYFHTSTQAYPTYSLELPALFYLDANYSSTASQLVAYPESENSPLVLYQPGDLIKVGNSSEVIKVVSMYRLTAANDYNIDVIRGWSNTVKAAIVSSPQVQVFKIGTIRMFELEGNKPSPVKQGKIRIKDTGYIVHTDLLGYVISGSAPTI